MDPPKFLVGFNLPDLKIPTGKRDVTNVPNQALILMNDPFVMDLAYEWSSQLVKQKDESVARRIQKMFHKAYGRAPDSVELKRWTALVHDLGGTADQAELLVDSSVWNHVAHAIFNTKEFIYYR